MKLSDIRRQRLRNERLIGAPLGAAHEAVQWLGAVQSQDYGGAAWGIGQRVAGCTRADIDAAMSSGAILRTHMMRPTWHFVAAEDIRWMQTLTAPRVQAANAGRYRQLELDAATLKRTAAILKRELRDDTHLTRPEIGAAFEKAGISTAGQRLAHTMMHAELESLICSGPLRGKQQTYALLDDRVPAAKQLSRDEALAKLAGRYVASHGPAMPQDFAWWSGLTVADARRGFEAASPQLSSEAIEGNTYWFVEPKAPLPRIRALIVHLLPNYDEYLIAYRDHSSSSHPAVTYDAATIESAFFGHIIVLDGFAVGGWKRTIAKGVATIDTTLPIDLTAPQRKALQAAAERYGRFIGMPVLLQES